MFINFAVHHYDQAMKRFFLTIFLAVSLHALIANPLPSPTPTAFISELYFIDQDTWQLEIFLTEYDDTFYMCDSVIILSQSSRFKLFDTYLVPPNNLYVVQSADCPGFYLDHQQDSLVIITYYSYYYNEGFFIHTLVYGCSDCFIPALNPGQSICCVFEQDDYPKDYFYKDDSPTVGESNDFEGATAYLQGKMYDMNGQHITSLPENTAFCLNQNLREMQTYWYGKKYYDMLGFSIDADGNYSTGILAHQSEIVKLRYLIDVWENIGNISYFPILCDTIDFNLEPGSVLDVDIHFSNSAFVVGISDPIKRASPGISVVVAPNPFSDITQLYFESDEGLSDVTVHIYNAAGSILKTYLLPQGEKTMLTIRKSDLGAAGIYSYIVQRESNVLRSGKLVCN
jgi:hypothetical protein